MKARQTAMKRKRDGSFPGSSFNRNVLINMSEPADGRESQMSFFRIYSRYWSYCVWNVTCWRFVSWWQNCCVKAVSHSRRMLAQMNPGILRLRLRCYSVNNGNKESTNDPFQQTHPSYHTERLSFNGAWDVMEDSSSRVDFSTVFNSRVVIFEPAYAAELSLSWLSEIGHWRAIHGSEIPLLIGSFN